MSQSDERSNTITFDYIERRLITLTSLLTGIGLLSIIFFAVYIGSLANQDGVRTVPLAAAAGLILAGAAGMVGMLLGYLFGMPRSEKPEESTNTSLEQVADWLTKILIGAGLAEIGALPGWFGRLGEFVRPAFGGVAAGSAFGIAVAIYFLVCGFFGGYLWGQLYMPSALRTAGSNMSAIRAAKAAAAASAARAAKTPATTAATAPAAATVATVVPVTPAAPVVPTRAAPPVRHLWGRSRKPTGTV